MRDQLGAAGPGATPDWQTEGNQAAASYGSDVGSAGDLNGDGYADIVASALLFDGVAGSNTGQVRMFAGGPGGPATSDTWSAEGAHPNALFGSSCAAAGDANGDGFGDLVVGARFFTNGESSEGAAFLYLGSSDDLVAQAAWTGEPDQASAEYASTVARAGDVNGDGYDDVIVAAPRFDNGQTDEGSVFVYHGSPTGTSTSFDWSSESDQANSRWGTSAASAGDVNGDGYDDVVVGAFLHDSTLSNEGRAALYMGSSAGLELTAAWTFDGAQATAQAGYSVAGAGDINGDGFADVLVGARRYDDTEIDEGHVFLFHGSATGLSATPDWSGQPNVAGANFGQCVRGAGDINGDGYADVVIGAPLYSNGQTSEGAAFVYHGSATGLSAVADWMLESDQTFATLGGSVDGAGDTNADGYADVIIGAELWNGSSSNEGGIFVFNGSPAGLGSIPDFTSSGNQPNSSFGSAVGKAGDINADGYSDIVVGGRLFDLGGSDNGIAVAFLGSAVGIVGPAAWLTSGNSGDQHGISVASAGDVNGDGYSDVIVGRWLASSPQTDEGVALLYLGNKGGGPAFGAHQRTPADDRRVGLGNLSGSNSSFRVRAEARSISGSAGTTAGREVVGLEYEAKALGSLLDGTGLQRSAVGSDTGVPGGTASLGETVSGLASDQLFAWRARITTRNPEFPHSIWFSAASSSHTETVIRTESYPDCNGNDIDDLIDISAGTSLDCNSNSIPDECDISSSNRHDCKSNRKPDECDNA